MNLVVVECEWDLGLNGDQFGQGGNIGYYTSMEDAVDSVRNSYDSSFTDSGDESFDDVVEDGLITFNQGRI
jgi:hypothetical protein